MSTDDGEHIYPTPPRIELSFPEGSRLSAAQAVYLQDATDRAVDAGFRAGCDGKPWPPVSLTVEPTLPAHEADRLRRQVQDAVREGYRWGHHARTGEWTARRG